jgi:hypothetical protein
MAPACTQQHTSERYFVLSVAVRRDATPAALPDISVHAALPPFGRRASLR